VQPDADVRALRGVGTRLGQAVLDGDDAAQGFARALEGDEDAVLLAAVDMAAVKRLRNVNFIAA
jgi:hypothetical protein